MSGISNKISAIRNKLIHKLKSLSFKTGVIILLLCLPCYIISFAQMALDLSYSMKGFLWFIFFGLAKAFQYTGLLIIGVEEMKRLKKFWTGSQNKKQLV